MESDDPILLGLNEHVHETDIDTLRADIAESKSTRRSRFAYKFFLAALSTIPWVGGYLSAVASIQAEESSIKENDLQYEWLEEHHVKIDRLKDTLTDIDARFQTLGAEIEERVESEEYLALVRKAFRVWDVADTEEKRGYVANLVTNAGGTRLCSDDLVRLFTE